MKTLAASLLSFPERLTRVLASIVAVVRKIPVVMAVVVVAPAKVVAVKSEVPVIVSKSSDKVDICYRKVGKDGG